MRHAARMIRPMLRGRAAVGGRNMWVDGRIDIRIRFAAGEHHRGNQSGHHYATQEHSTCDAVRSRRPLWRWSDRSTHVNGSEILRREVCGHSGRTLVIRGSSGYSWYRRSFRFVRQRTVALLLRFVADAPDETNRRTLPPVPVARRAVAEGLSPFNQRAKKTRTAIGCNPRLLNPVRGRVSGTRATSESADWTRSRGRSCIETAGRSVFCLSIPNKRRT